MNNIVPNIETDLNNGLFQGHRPDSIEMSLDFAFFITRLLCLDRHNITGGGVDFSGPNHSSDTTVVRLAKIFVRNLGHHLPYKVAPTGDHVPISVVTANGDHPRFHSLASLGYDDYNGGILVVDISGVDGCQWYTDAPTMADYDLAHFIFIWYRYFIPAMQRLYVHTFGNARWTPPINCLEACRCARVINRQRIMGPGKVIIDRCLSKRLALIKDNMQHRPATLEETRDMSAILNSTTLRGYGNTRSVFDRVLDLPVSTDVLLDAQYWGPFANGLLSTGLFVTHWDRIRLHLGTNRHGDHHLPHLATFPTEQAQQEGFRAGVLSFREANWAVAVGNGGMFDPRHVIQRIGQED